MEAAAEIGSTANHYQVLAKLATGGMAEIFLARSAGVASVQRYVVLKRVLRERASDMTFIRMFLDEARLAAQLQHANVAQVYDVGKLGDSYFFTMEYVHGETVRAVLARARELRRSPPLGCVLAIAAGTAAGLHHAHTRIGIEGRPLGIVHRDVSPSNLMVGFDGGVKVVDFGVAKAADRVEETRSGAVKGKIGYLSPEQARGQRLDQRSDLFSLGIVMWELLTVERLYKLDSDFATMTAIIHEPTPPPSSRRRDIPPEVDGLVLRALAKDPADRFQTAEEMAEAIERVAIQNNAALSPASLSRFIKEMFGARPEPWHTLQAPRATGAPSIVTVTSEPLPAELAIPISDPIDRRLANLVDLSSAELTSETSPMPMRVSDRAGSGLPIAPRMPLGVAGAPLPVTASLSAVAPPVAAIAEPMPPGSGPRRVVPGPAPTNDAAMLVATAASGPRPGPTSEASAAMLVAAASGPRPAPTSEASAAMLVATAASGPRPAPASEASASMPRSETELVARHHHASGWQRWRVPLLAGGTGIAVAVVIAVVVGRGGRTVPDPAQVASREPADAAVATVADAAITVEDAPVATSQAPDATPTATGGGSAGSASAGSAGSAGSATGSASGSGSGSGAPPVTLTGSGSGAPPVTLTARNRAIVAACSAGTNTDFVECTLAACMLDDAPNAKRWYRKVKPGAAQQRVARLCASVQVPIAPGPPPVPPPRPPAPNPPPKPDCARDPFACPR